MQKRNIWSKIEEQLSNDKTIVITGPRRVGKTTTIRWALDRIDSNNYYYFDLENVSNRDLFSLRDYDSLLNEFQNVGLNKDEKMYIAIDEIQYVKEIPSIVKYIQDNYNVKFLLSGSSSFYLKSLFSESLAGRKVLYEMYPLTFKEFLDFQGVNYTFNVDLSGTPKFNRHAYEKLNTYYAEYIQYGGYPEVAKTQDNSEKKRLLEEAFSSYINQDVQSLSDFKSLKDFRKLIQLLAIRVGSKVNTTELSRILGVTRPTIDSYIEFMEKTYLIKRVPVYSDSHDVKVRKQEKVYFIDNGILNINGDLSSGSKFENIVSSQLSYHKSLEYFEKRNQEVDFIVNKKYAVEVKETPDKEDLSKLRKLSDSLQLENALLVGRGVNESFNDYLWGGFLG